MSSRSRVHLENWLKSIDAVGEVLDVGGSQNPIANRVKSINRNRIFILDLEQPHEVKTKPHIVCDIQETLDDSVTNMYEWRFDTVFCIEVSEYWVNPLRALKNIKELMKLHGELYISFHTLYMLHPPQGEDCLRYTANGIRKLLERTGFEIEYMLPRPLDPSSIGYLQTMYKNEGMRGMYQDSETYHEGYLVKAIRLL